MRANGVVRWLAVLVLALPACAHNCVPTELALRRDLIDLDATQVHSPADGDVIRRVAEEFQRQGTVPPPAGSHPYQILALSGGGLFGAFGVGVLSGWSESGTRPTFDIVTGVSTGALIATFAFLGPDHDAFLRTSMVGVEPRSILRRLPLFALPLVGALYSPDPLTRRIEAAITPQLLAEVARAHRAGRRLYIATTSLDVRRLVIWDMGAIATRGTDEALALYRAVLLASSAVPGALPPVLIPVEIDGQHYQELHVDGGISTQVFFRAAMVGDVNQAAGIPGTWAPPGSTLYIVNNGKVYPEPTCVHGLFSALGATVDDIYSNKTRDEFYQIYLNCLETGLAFRATAIPQDLPLSSRALDVRQDDQRLLYEAGHRVGRAGPGGCGWRSTPPGLEPTEQVLPRSGTHFASPAPAPRP